VEHTGAADVSHTHIRDKFLSNYSHLFWGMGSFSGTLCTSPHFEIQIMRNDDSSLH